MKKLFALSLILPFSLNAMDLKHEVIQTGAIIAGGVATACVFSQGAEWFSTTIAPESTRRYNNTFYTPIRGSEAWFNKWGFLGTMWAGLPIALAARCGADPLDARELIKPAVIAYGATMGVAAIAGVCKYMQKKDREKAGSTAALSTRISSYVVAPVGLIGYVLYRRIKD